jgi:hypothetical protein
LRASILGKEILRAPWRLAFLFAIAVMLLGANALAQEADNPDENPAEDESESEPVAETPASEPVEGEEEPDLNIPGWLDPYSLESPLWMGDYGRWIKHAQNTLLEMDIWGSSATVPEGFLVTFFGYGTQRAAGRFDENRQLVELVPLLKVPNPFIGREGDFFSFDFNASGTTKGYFVGAQYGITDRIMLGFSLFGAVVDIKMDPIFTPGTSEMLGIATLEEFYTLLEEIGRPRPKTSYKTEGIDLGDATLSCSWNYFRGEWYAGGVTGTLIIPTSHRADPNSALIFGLGPDIDTGNGSWGASLSKVFDFRPPKPLNVATFSIGMEGAYFLTAKRKSPDFPAPNQDVKDYMDAQAVELDFLPDLSDMDSHYYYTPGPWLAASAGIGAGPISITYRHGWGFEPEFQSNSPGFKKMIDELGLVGNGDDGKIIAAVSIPLTPLYIPALMQFRTEYMTDGRNALVFRDVYQMGIGFIIPLAPPDRYRLPR